MKKIFSIGALIGLLSTSSAFAQYTNGGHIVNKTFETDAWKKTCGNTFTTINQSTFVRPGIEPENWNGSNVYQVMDFPNFVQKGSEGTCILTNQKPGFATLSAEAPAFLTLGTPWIFADTNKTGGNGLSLGDGGVYGGAVFENKPDAIRVSYKRDNSNGTEDAYIIAYLWNGTFKSQARSAITKTGGNLLKPVYSESATIQLEDMDRAVMGKVTCDEGSTGSRVAYIEKTISSSNTEWITETIPFIYDDPDGSVEKVNIIISAADYWTRDNIVNGNILEIDNVDFVYYSTLEDLKVNGVSVSNFDKDTYEYTVIGNIKDAAIEGTTTSQFATVSTTKSGNQANVVVTANDGSQSTYTINFVPDANDVAGTYSSLIYVDYGEGSVSINNVEITANSDNTVNFILNGFSFPGLGEVGNIFVPNVNVTWNGNNIALSSEQNITIEGDYTDMLKDMPLKLNATIDQNKILTANLTIVWNGITIEVSVEKAPFTYAIEDGVLNLSEGTVDDNGMFVIYTEIENGRINVVDMSKTTINSELFNEVFNNESPVRLVYVGDNEITGDNVVSKDKCFKLNISDTYGFSAPKGFTATDVAYDRVFKTDADYVSTFILPFGFTVPEGVTVAKLTAVNDGVLTFTPVAVTEANTPYVVLTDKENFIDGLLSNVEVQPTTGDLSVTVGDYSHIGTYTQKDVENSYGYQGGKFVYGKGTVNPFRTYIVKKGESEVKSLSVLIDGGQTGIGHANANANANANAVYNLQGVKMGANVKNLKKGVYVVNGNKVIIK